MTQRVPTWDLKDDNVNPNHQMFKFDYEVAELTWENGQLTLHELGTRRVPSKSQPTTSWDQPCAAETLEALVNQATLQPYCKTDAAVNDDELVPWMPKHNPTVAVGKLNESAAGTSDALVPNSNNRTGEGSGHAQPSFKSARDAVVSSCSGNPSAFMDPRVQQQDRDLGGRRLISTSTGSPENTSSGRDCSNTTFPNHTACHHRTQRDRKTVNEKAKSSILNKRRRTAAIHNQSERKRRDKINQKLKTLLKLVPNSSKTDKASMLDEVIEHIKQLQMNIHTMSMMNMSPMTMMSFVMQQQQQQLQIQKSLMNSLGMGMGMGMGGMDLNTIGPCHIPTSFYPSAFMQMPSWNNHPADQVSPNAITAGGPMPAFLASQSPALNMESYSRMAALYQQMQNQPCGPFSRK